MLPRKLHMRLQFLDQPRSHLTWNSLPVEGVLVKVIGDGTSFDTRQRTHFKVYVLLPTAFIQIGIVHHFISVPDPLCVHLIQGLGLVQFPESQDTDIKRYARFKQCICEIYKEFLFLYFKKRCRIIFNSDFRRFRRFTTGFLK